MSARVQLREPSMDNVIGFVDGVSLTFQYSELPKAQAEACNRYHLDTRCNNVFAFSSFGKIIFACINHSGSCYDANVSVALARKVIKDLDPYAFSVFLDPETSMEDLLAHTQRKLFVAWHVI